MKKVLFLVVLSFLGLYSTIVVAQSAIVVMNVKTYIYHSPDCKWAKRCTKNCVKTTLEDALAQGARACMVCGG